jgi:hypothetical protein
MLGMEQQASGIPVFPGQEKAEQERLRYMLEMQQAVPVLNGEGMRQADPYPEPDWESMRQAPSTQIAMPVDGIEPDTNWGRMKKMVVRFLR